MTLQFMFVINPNAILEYPLMNATSRLSPMTSYYLRKFIEDRQDILHALLPDLRGAITLDRLFKRMNRHGTSIEQHTQILESLVDLHKQVTKNVSPHPSEVTDLDKRLLLSLGIEGNMNHIAPNHASIKVAQDCVEVLNSLRTRALFFLGDKIGTKYLIETRPSENWCERFHIAPNAQISYRGKLDEGLNPQQISCFEGWIEQFANRCANVMLAFESDASQESEALFDNW